MNTSILVIRASKYMIGTNILQQWASFLSNICSFFIAFYIFIYSFLIHPLIKRSAMVDNAVQDYFHPVKSANPNAIILAEHYGSPKDWIQGGEWDTVMNYGPFMAVIKLKIVMV